MGEISRELLNLRQEVTKIRQERMGGTRNHHWPKPFKRRVIELIGSGYSITEISLATGIEQKTLNYWIKRQATRKERTSSFTELTVTASQSNLGSQPYLQSEIERLVLVGRKGNAVTGLRFCQLKALLGMGLL